MTTSAAEFWFLLISGGCIGSAATYALLRTFGRIKPRERY